ncbi:membrane protein [Streptomyces eurocidicus]|uniref:Membrane protein n=1 Tax=Streptomyces eurocidicus TaxID=66423 RepID=A0A2N8P1T6_STREU|nr:DUF58 domain-containing protein [Streptomyces eurocidicus]MBB5118548.1 uncharacterized protein (DUF58 family) [Streptomyces eurocidicus]MBF6051998.1 DUF58 domain-containing protein [Streptomyces eurocidicus]PNE34989.1 membrane protein [Streptomyces eurocidicus]
MDRGEGAPGTGGREPGGGYFHGLGAALGGLTTRGRSFLAAGVAAAGCAYVLGQSDLLRVGLLLAVLPLVCVLVLHGTRHRVTGSRRLTPARVSMAAEARVHLRIDNVSRLPTGLLMLQDRVPYVLGPRPRFVLDRVEPGGRREVAYRVRSELRGRYPLGPLQLRLTDPFGMCELTRGFSAYDTLTVVPRVDPLPPTRLGGEATGYGDGRARSLALAGEDDVIPRGYRHGDDLRRVHWRSTARHGELMVRREEQPQRAHCTVLLDTRGVGYEGVGPDAPFEWAVSGAASAAVHLLERGFAVRLLTDTGSSLPGPDGGGGAHDASDAAGLLLDALAVVDHSAGDGLSPAYDALLRGGEGLLVAFLGGLDDRETAVVARMRGRSRAAVAFVLDPAAWAADARAHDPRARQAAERRLRVLREAGWTALSAAPGASLPELWRLAGGPPGTAGAAEQPGGAA